MQIIQIFEHSGHLLTWRGDGVVCPSRLFFGDPSNEAVHPRALAYEALFREPVQRAKTMREFDDLCTLFKIVSTNIKTLATLRLLWRIRRRFCRLGD